MALLQRGKSDIEVMSEVAELLRPYLLQDIEITVEEEESKAAAGKRVIEMEIEYKGLRCSGLRVSYEGGEKKPVFLQRIVDVCDILGRLRHPCLVQFLGVSYDPRDGSPPLIVSESLPVPLAACIEKHGVLPSEISYGIVRDVALGLRYLHEQKPSFVHGDLSTRCVLLTGEFTAKISQIGVPHLRGGEGQIGPHHYHLPPEVTENCKRFDRKVDIFSLGIIMLHAFTGRSPIPRDVASSDTDSTGSPQPSNRFPSQADLRLDYINDLGTNHPMADTILHCLKNQPILRPEIWEMAHVLCRQATSHQNLFAQSSAAHRNLLHCHEKERKRKFCRFFTQVSVSDSAYGSVSEAEVEELQIRCRRLSVQNKTLRRISLTPEHLVHLNSFCSRSLLPQPLTPDEVKFDWEQCTDLPVGMFRAQATIVCGRVYIGGGLTEHEGSDFHVFEYNLTEDSWELMPPLPTKFFGLGRLSQDLVAVGGQVHNEEELSDKMYVFDQFNQIWKESAATLNIARFSLTIVESETCLVAMGGLGRDERGDLVMLSSIEVMGVDSTRWVVTGDLPNLAAVCSPSLAMDGSTLYLVGGYRAQTAVSATSRVHSSSLSALTSASGMATKSWKPLPPTPHLQSTALTLNHCILSLGGSDQPYSSELHGSIHAFDAGSCKWVKVDELPYQCCHCTVVGVTRDEVLVLGGWVKPGERKASRSVFRGRLMRAMSSSDTDESGDYITLPAITITL